MMLQNSLNSRVHSITKRSIAEYCATSSNGFFVGSSARERVLNYLSDNDINRLRNNTRLCIQRAAPKRLLHNKYDVWVDLSFGNLPFLQLYLAIILSECFEVNCNLSPVLVVRRIRYYISWANILYYSSKLFF